MIKLPENLIQSLRSGDGKAYEELYGLYFERIYALSYGILQNHSDAQDAVQQTFIRVYQKLPTLKNDDAFSGWIMKIAQNESLKLLKSRKTILSLEDCTEPELSETEIDDSSIPEEALEHNETCRILHQCIETLSAEQRETVTLFYFHEMKIKEIAELMECSEATAKTRLFYARRHIADEWEKRAGAKSYKLGGVMLPVGEAFVRLLRKEIQQKKRQSETWKEILPSLYLPGSSGTMPGGVLGNTLAVKLVAGIMACVIAATCMAGFAAMGEKDDKKSGSAFGGFGTGQQKAQNSTLSPVIPTSAYDPISAMQNQQDLPVSQNYADNAVPVNGQQIETQNRSNVAPPTTAQPETQNSTQAPTTPAATQPETRNLSQDLLSSGIMQTATKNKTEDFSMFADSYQVSGVGGGLSKTMTLDADGTFLGSTCSSDDSLYYNDSNTKFQIDMYFGVFTDIKRIDEYTYSFKISHIQYTSAKGESVDIDGSGEIVYAYLPGKPLYSLPSTYAYSHYLLPFKDDDYYYRENNGLLHEKCLDFPDGFPIADMINNY